MKLLSETRVAQRITPRRIGWFHKALFRVDGEAPVVVTAKLPVDREPIAPIILVHGFGQNRYAWHLPTRSFANHLAEQGFAVFNVDLRGHGRSRELGASRSRGVDDYIRGDLPAVIDGVLDSTGFRRTFLMGHSLGGICVAAAGAEQASQVAGVITLGPPFMLGRGHVVLGHALRMAGHTVGTSGFLRGSQRRLPMDVLGKLMHATRAAWNSPLAPIPVRAYKPGSFSRHDLVQFVHSFDSASFGTIHDLLELAVTGDLRSKIDGASFVRAIENSPLPLLAVSGAADLLANPGSVKPIYERSRSADKRYVKLDAGHSDLLIGRQAPGTTWPLVTSWLAERVASAGSALPGWLPATSVNEPLGAPYEKVPGASSELLDGSDDTLLEAG